MTLTEAADDLGRLVRLAEAGDERAWSQLVDRFSPMLWSITRQYRLSADDAADVIQMTWLRLLQHISRLRDPHVVGAWLATTARRQCLAHVATHGRMRRSEYGDELLDGRPAGGDVDERLLREERDQILYAALTQLPPRQQLLLRLLSSSPAPSYRDVSVATGIPIGSIGPTRARALQRLREALSGQQLLAS